MITVTAPIWLWNTAQGSWHFLTIPAAGAAPLRLQALTEPRRGFGSIRVEARIGEVAWRTSIFPQKDGGYILPVKAEVRRRAGIGAGDAVEVTLAPL